MSYIVVALLAAVVAAFVYALWLRPALKRQPWAQSFFAWVEPLEIALFKNSETILVARVKMLLGVLLAVLGYLGSVDLTPFLVLVPEAYRDHAQAIINMLPLVLTLVGMMDERLRNQTTKPIELVALPTTKEQPPQVAIALADAELAKETAVAVVKERTDA